MNKPWVKWLMVLIGGLLLGGGASFLLAKQGSPNGSNILMWITQAFAVLWLLWGFWIGRNVPGMKTVGAMVIATLCTAAITIPMLSSRSYSGYAIVMIGIWAMAELFVIGLWLIRLLLSGGHPVFGVARTLVDEAIRMKIALIFIIGVVLLIPVLPILIDAQERLDYRVKFFLNWSMGGMSVLLSLMTVFLVCGSICGEITRKNIFMTMVKPVSRIQYLMGKWLGVALLNMLLLAVSGVGIYTLTQILARQPVSNPTTPQIELGAVRYEVLTARQSAKAVPPDGMDFAGELQSRHERLRRENPDEYGERLTAQQRKAIQNRIIAQWYAIGPNESQTYVFENLQPAVERNLPIQLRFKPKMSKAPDDEMVRMGLWINDRPYPIYQGQHIPTEVANDNFHVMSIDPAYVDDQGKIKLRIQNVNLMAPEATFPATISFSPGSGLEMLYNIGSFGPNLARSLAMIWVRLGFLAMLGVMAGTFLGFPVACLLSFMIYFAAIASNYLKESLRFYAGYSDMNVNLWEKLVLIWGAFIGSIGDGKYWDAFKIVIRLVGEMFIAIVPEFSTYNPTPLVSDGRVVSMGMLGSSAIWVGLVSSGFCLLMAWIIFRRRELAKVTV